MTQIWETGELFIKELDILDCARFCKKRGVTGQSWYVDVFVQGRLDENGFVCDFSDTKKIVKQSLKETLDHALLVPALNKNIDISQSNNQTHLCMNSVSGTWRYSAPSCSVYLLESSELSTQQVETHAERIIKGRLPKTVSKVKVKLREERAESTFRYTHGLPQHKGLCQRLLHGHRSKIMIERDGVRSSDCEDLITNTWLNQSIHIAEPKQFKSTPWKPYTTGPEDQIAHLGYQSEEGLFELVLPASKVFIVEQATSIESIAKGFLKKLKSTFSQSNFVVIPYEGINKGGIATDPVEPSHEKENF